MKPISELEKKLSTGAFDSTLQHLYFEPEQVERQRERYMQALNTFRNTFGAGDVSVYSAPGRTEIGGNHTDHQHGQVLAASIHLDAIAVVRKSEEPVIRLLSEGYALLTLPLSDYFPIKKSDFGTTRALICGVCQGFLNQGLQIGGFDAYVTSDVLIGAGLSSSAAFETLLGTILSALYNNFSVDAITIAIIGQYAENQYFGKPCGLMDQMACSVGNLVHIDFAMPEAPIVRRIEVDFDTSGYDLCITDTKGSHANLTPDYAAIPAEMNRVAHLFQKDFLKDVTPDEIYLNLSYIREKAGDRAALRAIHFVEENARVASEVAALSHDDMPKFLSLVNASGNSSFKYLQNVYSPQDLTHQNVAVALALSEHLLNGDGAIRIHGGGFAGTMEAFVPTSLTASYQQKMNAVFGSGSCKTLHIRKQGGIRVL